MQDHTVRGALLSLRTDHEAATSRIGGERIDGHPPDGSRPAIDF